MKYSVQSESGLVMKYKIKFLPSANQDINDLADILTPYPNKARRLFQEMEQKIESLKDNPLMYPEYQADPRYRRMNLEGHALFYDVDVINHEIRVYRIIYAKRDIAKLLIM